MSTNSNYEIPGGVPPTPVKGSKSGCWISGIAGCGILFIIFILAIIYSATKLASDSGLQKMFSSITASKTCGNSLIQLRTALRSYKRDHRGQYPKSLDQLKPRYFSGSEFVCRNDDESYPMTYEQPSGDTPANTQVVTIYTGQSTIMKKQTQDIYYCLLKDDSIVMQQVASTVIVPQNGDKTEDP